MKKTGYFRIIQDNICSEVSYAEFYNSDDEYKNRIKNLFDRGQIKIYCACRSDNYLELNLTKNYILRVKENGRQTEHADSCPKSVFYTKWLEENGNGIHQNEYDQIIFDITLPTGEKRVLNQKRLEKKEEDEESNTRAKKMDVVELAKKVNTQAWLIQTYSIKKKIRDGRVNGEKAEWQYKQLDEFNKLFYGVTNDIIIRHRKEQFPLNNLCYRCRTFYNASNEEKFFVYAPIIKISEYKEDRKYQYITVKMASNISKDKAVVRIPTTDITEKTYNTLGAKENQCYTNIYVGYVKHDCFTKENEDTHWITNVKGAILKVSQNGLYIKNEEEALLYNTICSKKERIIFTKPLFPLQSFGNNIPSLVIERKNKKSILVDIANGEKDYNDKIAFIEDNEEYECLLYNKKNANISNIYSDILRELKND